MPMGPRTKGGAGGRSSRAEGVAAGDLLSIVEAAYSMDAPGREWALRILQTTDSVIGAGIGAFACSFAGQANGTMRVDRQSVISLGVNDDMLAAIFDDHEKAPSGWLSEYFGNGRGFARCLLTSEVEGRRKMPARGALAARGVYDGVNVGATDNDDRGFLLSFAVPGDYRLTSVTRRSLTRVAIHILAAIRLRARLRDPGSPEGEISKDAAPPEAILSPTGDVLHAEGAAKLAAARRVLANAVGVVEHIRTSMRESADTALERWKGLVGARWTLVDSLESDGQRYIVARDNRLSGRGPSVLTDAERSVVTAAARGLSTKEIAYASGISDTTVRVLLMRAARRCSVRSRLELLSLWRAWSASKLET